MRQFWVKWLTDGVSVGSPAWGSRFCTLAKRHSNQAEGSFRWLMSYSRIEPTVTTIYQRNITLKKLRLHQNMSHRRGSKKYLEATVVNGSMHTVNFGDRVDHSL